MRRDNIIDIKFEDNSQNYDQFSWDDPRAVEARLMNRMKNEYEWEIVSIEPNHINMMIVFAHPYLISSQSNQKDAVFIEFNKVDNFITCSKTKQETESETETRRRLNDEDSFDDD